MTGPQLPIGTPVAGGRGEPLGTVDAVYVDNATGLLAWAAVLGGAGTAVVPLQVSRFDGAVLHVPYDADRLASAPPHDAHTLISYEAGDDLARHYGLLPAGAGPTAPAPETVRSEERLRTGVVNVVVGRARLETYVVVEERTFTVPVRRQEVRVVHDLVPAAEQVVSDVAPAAASHEVVLHAEEVVVTTRVVPVERARLVRRVVAHDQTVTEQIRSEQVDVDRTTPTEGDAR